jgi:hypothetical protein
MSTKVFRWLGFYLLIPAAVAFAPAVLYSGPQWWSRLTNLVTRSPAEASPESPPAALPDPAPAAGPATPSSSAPSDPTPATTIEEVLRLDVTPGWVLLKWPRVSAGLGELQLQGYRVPLVSGTAEDDLAGALTYYFNPQQQVERITFSGTTGDPQRLVRCVSARFGLARRPTNDPGIILYEVLGPDRRPRSTLCLRPAPVVKASDALARFNVALTIQRP